MANRAYLFTADLPETDWPDIVNLEDRRYYDSRHSLPLAWLFFFRSRDLRLVGDEIRFVADRESACQYFKEKKHLIEGFVVAEAASYLDELFRKIQEWPSRKFLLLCSGSVGDFYEENLHHIQFILDSIENPSANINSIKEAILRFPDRCIIISFDDIDRLRGNLIGYTYW